MVILFNLNLRDQLSTKIISRPATVNHFTFACSLFHDFVIEILFVEIWIRNARLFTM